MSSIYLNPLVTPIGSAYELRDERRGKSPLSAELLAISASLKEAIEGLRGWIQAHPLMHSLRKSINQGSDRESFATASKELSRLSTLFRGAYSELRGYNQQIPEPADISASFAMQRLIEDVFLVEISKVTSFDLLGWGPTSWGALLLSEKETDWSFGLLHVLFQEISLADWREARHLMAALQKELP